MRFSAALFVSLLISGCVGMPISSMLKLRNMEPLETDPAGIRIAVITDKIVQLSNGSTSLTMGYSSEYPEFTFSNKSKATIINDATVPELESKRGPEQNITLFYLAEDAARIMKDAQSRI
jgi:hypothetical protein